jgi:protein SCO1/2
VIRRRRFLSAAAFPMLAALASCRRSDTEETLPIQGKVAPFTLTNQDGQPFGTEQLTGRVWIADFFFTNCPGPCPRMSTLMGDIQRQTQDIEELRIVSITVDPDRDTPEAMKAYGKRYGAIDGRWHFLTGPRDTLHRLASQDFKLFDVDGSLQHSTRFALVDREGNIRAFYTTGLDGSYARLPEDVRKLIRQSKPAA